MRFATLSLLLLTTALHAGEPMCGTGPENDQRLAALHEQVAERGRVRSLATEIQPVAREGAFYVQNDDIITTGYRPFDLTGQSVVFTPAGTSGYRMKREPLRYVEPSGPEVRNFQGATGENWHFVRHDLAGPFTIFGRTVSRIYVSAFNGIYFKTPVEQGGMQFDAIESAVHRDAVLSPLMITTRKPRQLEYPRIFIDEAPGLVRVTWRSSGNAPFGYDIQAEMRSDGGVTYSYRSMTAIRWGTALLSPGFDPAITTRTVLNAVDDSTGDVSDSVPQALRAMVNIRRTEVSRVRDSDLFAVRIELAAPIDRTKLAPGESLVFQAALGTSLAVVEVSATQTTVIPFTGIRADVNGASAHVNGNVVEIYGIQPKADQSSERSFRAITYYRPLNRISDSSTLGVSFTPAPHLTSTDLSAVAESTTLALPIAEPFLLGIFDPFEVWHRVQTAFSLNDYEYDAVAMYQTFFTEMIFYAGAYATGGNPQVDGLGPSSPFLTTQAPRRPTLLHMNQLTYNYSAAEATASKLLLHEFGHRWLYYFSIRENGQTVRALNPVSPHPAAFVHTASAFPVYGPEESSVMGGAFFTPQGDGSYKAHAANMGYSWPDLYMMGVVAPEEVQPWFYIANTTLPKEYWPEEGAVATGQRRDVQISQIREVHGPRIPSASLAQRKFKVLFVLVTEEGTEPTEAEVAKVNEWRAVMERNFARATGDQAHLSTAYVRPSKRRAAR